MPHWQQHRGDGDRQRPGAGRGPATCTRPGDLACGTAGDETANAGLCYNAAAMSSIPPATAQSPAAAFLARRRPDRLTLLIAAIALLGVALALAREATYGVVLQIDSFAYIRAARDLLAGDGFSATGGYTTWPPLYPLLLATASLGVFDPYAVAGPLNAAIFGLTIFIVGQYLRHRMQSRFLALWACLALALSIPLATAASYAMTETPFILIVTLALILTDKFLADGKASSLFWAAAFCALAWLTRHIGVAAAVFVGLLILLQRGAPLPQKAKRIAGLSLIVGLPAALWRLRNYLAAGDLPDNIYQLNNLLPTLILEVFSVLWRWLYSGLPWEPWLLTAPSAAVLITCCCILIIEQYKKRNLLQWRPLCHIRRVYAGIHRPVYRGVNARGNHEPDNKEQYGKVSYSFICSTHYCQRDGIGSIPYLPA